MQFNLSTSTLAQTNNAHATRGMHKRRMHECVLQDAHMLHACCMHALMPHTCGMQTANMPHECTPHAFQMHTARKLRAYDIYTMCMPHTCRMHTAQMLQTCCMCLACTPMHEACTLHTHHFICQTNTACM